MRVLLQQTRRENQELRQKTDIINMSGFETTQKAFSDKVHELNDFIKEKDKNTHQLKNEINNLREENDRLNEELSMCKKLHKTGIATKNGWVTESIDEEIQLLSDRTTSLELMYDEVRKQRNSVQDESRRQIQKIEFLEKELVDLKAKHFNAETESRTSTATFTQLNQALFGKEQELEILRQKHYKLEKVVNSQKDETSEVERRAENYRTQLESTTENYSKLSGQQ